MNLFFIMNILQLLKMLIKWKIWLEIDKILEKIAQILKRLNLEMELIWEMNWMII